MTTEHDFKKALNAYESNTYDTPQEWVSCAGVIGDRELDETIRFALKLAEKVCGEPSKEARWQGSMAAEDNVTVADANEVFKAMLQQMLKEIGEGE